MTTVSVLVDDLDRAVDVLCNSLGVPRPRPQALREGPGIRAMFCRVHPKYPVAPTFLEIVSPGPVGDVGSAGGVFPVVEIAARQGSRPVKWHATELSMPDDTLMDLSGHLDGLGVPHGFVPSDHPRSVLPRWGSERLLRRRRADAGLVIEAGKSSHLGLPEDALSAPADIPRDAEPATMVRIVAREYLVDDLDETLRVLERNLRWTPTSLARARRSTTGGHAVPGATQRVAGAGRAPWTGPGRRRVRRGRCRGVDDPDLRGRRRREGRRPHVTRVLRSPFTKVWCDPTATPRCSCRSSSSPRHDPDPTLLCQAGAPWTVCPQPSTRRTATSTSRTRSWARARWTWC